MEEKLVLSGNSSGRKVPVINSKFMCRIRGIRGIWTRAAVPQKNQPMSAARNEAHALRRCADEARAISRTADVAFARAREAAKAAKAAAKEAEEAAQEAELVVSKLPGGLHGEPSMLVSDVLSGWHGEAAECVAQACINVFNPHWLISLATSCKHTRAGFDAELQALREEHRAVVSLCRKVGQTISEVADAYDLVWNAKELTDSDVHVLSCIVSSGSLRALTDLSLSYNQIGDAGMV